MKSPHSDMTRPDLVFRYVVSSTDMRFIERAERHVFLGSGAEGELVVWGEIPGCGDACRADLACLVLEYAMSCEASGEPRLWQEAAAGFAHQTGGTLGTEIAIRSFSRSAEARARDAIELLLRSLEPAAGTPATPGTGGRGFDACPICRSAQSSGTVRVLTPAHDLFLQLSLATVAAAAPGWTASCASDLQRSGHPLRLAATQDRGA